MYTALSDYRAKEFRYRAGRGGRLEEQSSALVNTKELRNCRTLSSCKYSVLCSIFSVLQELVFRPCILYMCTKKSRETRWKEGIDRPNRGGHRPSESRGASTVRIEGGIDRPNRGGHRPSESSEASTSASDQLQYLSESDSCTSTHGSTGSGTRRVLSVLSNVSNV